MPTYRWNLLPLLLSVALPATALAEVSPSQVMRSSGDDFQAVGELPVRGLGDDQAERALAPYFAATATDGPLETLPLKESRTTVAIAGVIAHVRMLQVFENTGSKPLEAVYLFPASTRSAVHGMRMKIGERTIEARIEKREAARAEFEQAREAGKRASLLEQQRPNVFTTTVTNLMPKDRIEVELEYSELLVPEDAVYELVVPAVVGPRYGGGADPKEDQWIANPYLKAGEKEPYLFDVQVALDTPLPLRDVGSPSHRIDVSYSAPGSAQVKLREEPGNGTRDFVLRYRLAGEKIESGVLVAQEGEGGFFTLLVEPPPRPAVEQILPREYIFVLDVSGSMGGFPLDTAKELMRNLLGQLRPTDHFNVVVFSGAAGVMSERSVAATAENLAAGISYVDGRGAGGGTELLGALERAYAIPKVDERVARTLVVVTDGYVGVEGKAFALVRERLSSANVFAFGIGTGVNRGLIEALARAGNGEPFVVLDAAKAKEKAEQLRRAIEQPLLTDIRIRYRGFEAREVTPGALPDLMAARPLVVFGKFDGEATGTIEITATSAGKPFRQTLEVAKAIRPAPALRWLWARSWIETLEDQFHLTQAPEVKAAIEDLGLSYRLLSRFTSFIAVDSEVVNRQGERTHVKQPLPLPAGVPNSAVAGNLFGGSALGIGGIGTRGHGGGSAAYGLGGVGLRGSGAGGGGMGKLGSAYTVVEPSGERITVKGSLALETLRKVMKRNRGQVRYCYERALQKQPNLAGKLVVRFTLDDQGAVVKAELAPDTTLASEDVSACVLARVKSWKFPAGNGAVTVTYPWMLKPAK